MVRRCSLSDADYEAVSTALTHVTVGTRTDRKRDLALLTVLAAYDDSGFMSARVLELLDYGNAGHLTAPQRAAVDRLWSQMPEARFDLITIHDCFRCHPNYGNDLRKQYRYILAEISESNLLSSLCSQIAGTVLPVNKIDPNMHLRVREAEYAIC
jgi:hypothetical protein